MTAGPGRAAPWSAGRVRPSPLLVSPAIVAVAVLGLPLVALVTRVDWAALPEHLTSEQARPAIVLSLLTTTSSTTLCLVLGTPLAWLLARSDARWVAWLRAALTVPLVLPPVVAGVALLSAYGRFGLVGRPLGEIAGITVPFTTTAVVLAETFVAMPFYVIAAEAAMAAVDSRLLGLAATLGSSDLRTVWRVVLPIAAPGLAAGAALAWARSLGEFGATITFAGSFPGRTQTVPLAVYDALDDNPDLAVSLSALLMVVCIVVLALLRGRWVR